MTIDPEKEGSFLRGEVWHGEFSLWRLLQNEPHSCLGFFLPHFRGSVVRSSQVGIDSDSSTFGGHRCPPAWRRFADESSHAADCVQVHHSFRLFGSLRILWSGSWSRAWPLPKMPSTSSPGRRDVQRSGTYTSQQPTALTPFGGSQQAHREWFLTPWPHAVPFWSPPARPGSPAATIRPGLWGAVIPPGCSATAAQE